MSIHHDPRKWWDKAAKKEERALSRPCCDAGGSKSLGAPTCETFWGKSNLLMMNVVVISVCFDARHRRGT
jgi:hypothetical protein